MTGTSVFVLSFLRRSIWAIVAMLLASLVLFYVQGVSIDALYLTQEEFDLAAEGMASNAAFIAMAGPARALNTTGGQVAWQGTAFGAVTFGLISMFLIGRRTRAEEESGREELLRAAPVGRQASTTAALLVAVLANAMVGVLTAGSLIGYGLDTSGSLLLAAGAMLSGCFFAAVALLAMQLTANTRTAYGITGVVIAVSYGLRAIGDVTENGLSWLSPIGWFQAMHPFSGDRWWPGLLLLAGTVLLTAAAYSVFARRDYGAGVVSARPGPARAAPGLPSGIGLAWRLQRSSVIGWTAGLFLGGLAFGSIGDDIDLFGDSDLVEIFVRDPKAMVDSFYAFASLLLAMIAAGFTIASALRPRQEEDEGRVESLLATGLPRRTWLLGQLAVTLGGTVATVASAGLGTGTGYALVTGDWSEVGRLTGAALALLPAVLLLGAIAVLVYGLWPRWASVAWLGMVFAFVVLLFGEVFQLPDWVQGISPFWHFALVPAEAMAWTPFLVVLALAAAGYAGGLLAFLRRDLNC